jgi:hypothetical protein
MPLAAGSLVTWIATRQTFHHAAGIIIFYQLLQTGDRGDKSCNLIKF